LESKWRQNVADMWMSDSHWRLAARILEDPNFVVVARMVFPNPRYEVWDVSDPSQLPLFVGDFAILSTAPHFPYGWEVEPD